MKIYILRHEERYDCPKFYTQLTSIGLKNSELLKGILDKENINLIFSSPFPRVLQTIKPYCDFKNMNQSVCIDYSLYETMYDPCFTSAEYPITLNKNDKEYYLMDPNYNSTIPLNNITCPESERNVETRITIFVTQLIEKYKNTNINILLASHASTLAPLVTNLTNTLYPLGGITKIYDNKKLCQPINY
jgi:broad specificity phosphatase PhoE